MGRNIIILRCCAICGSSVAGFGISSWFTNQAAVMRSGSRWMPEIVLDMPGGAQQHRLASGFG